MDEQERAAPEQTAEARAAAEEREERREKRREVGYRPPVADAGEHVGSERDGER